MIFYISLYFITSPKGTTKTINVTNASLEHSDVAKPNAVKLSKEKNHVVIRFKENVLQVATNISEKAAKRKILQLVLFSLILVAIWLLLYTDVFSLYETLSVTIQIEIYVPQTSAYKWLEKRLPIYTSVIIVPCLISFLAPLTFLFVLDTL